MVMVQDPLTDEPLLSAAEEVALALEIEAGALARAARLGEGGGTDATDTELLLIEQQGEHARQRYIRANLRLVAKAARQAAARSALAESDLFQEGCLGLICAVERFDCRLGYRFSTYASFWIRAAITAATASSLGGLNLSASRAGQLRAARGIEVELTQVYGRTVSAADVATSIGRSTRWTAELLASQAPRSFEGLDLDTAGWTAAPDVDDTGPDRPGRELLGHLDEPERQVVGLRYGFTDGTAHTFADISTRLQISISRARRLERQGLHTLRSVCPSSARSYL